MIPKKDMIHLQNELRVTSQRTSGVNLPAIQMSGLILAIINPVLHNCVPVSYETHLFQRQLVTSLEFTLQSLMVQ